MESKYNLNEVDFEIYQEFIQIFNNYDEQGFAYNGVEYGIDYEDGKILIYEDKEGGRTFRFNSADDFFNNFMLDGKPIIYRLSDLTDFD
jgi:hypothetical protein